MRRIVLVLIIAGCGRIALATTFPPTCWVANVRVIKGAPVPDLARRVRQRLATFLFCDERLRIKDDSVPGDHDVEWTIRKDGSIANVKVIRGNALLRPCLAEELPKHLRFEPIAREALVVATFHVSSAPVH